MPEKLLEKQLADTFQGFVDWHTWARPLLALVGALVLGIAGYFFYASYKERRTAEALEFLYSLQQKEASYRTAGNLAEKRPDLAEAYRKGVTQYGDLEKAALLHLDFARLL